MRKPKILKYVKTGYVKHYFYTVDAPMAICGRTVHWRSKQPWLRDPEGLEKRNICTKCVEVLNL